MTLQVKFALVAAVVAVGLIATSEPAYAVYIPCDCAEWWCRIFPIC